MKKITRYLSFLVMALFACLPSWAGGETSLDAFSNNAAYVIRSARGYMVYAPQYAPDFAWGSACAADGATPIEVDESEANNQWAILTSPKGFSYLWNVGAKKFLYKNENKTIFTEIPKGNDFGLLNSTGAAKEEYPWVLAFGTNQLNMVTSNRPGAVLSNWNSTSDEGNMMEIKKVADLTDDVLAAANAAITEFEKDIIVGINSLDQLSDVKSYYVMNPRGDWAYIPTYTYKEEVCGKNMLVATTMKDVPAELPTADKQFAFVKAASGNRYLYSVGAKKYVAVSANSGNTGTALVDTPVEKVEFLKGQGAKLYPWVLALNGKQIGVSPNYGELGGIITFWQSLTDEGNNVMVVEGDNFDATELVSALNSYEEGLQKKLADALVEANDLLVKVNDGTFAATEEQLSALKEAINAAQYADIAKDYFTQLIAQLDAAIAAIPQVVVPEVVINPDPVNGKLKEIPAEVTFTFKKEIKSAADALVFVGMGQSINIDASQIAVNGKVVTIKLPVDMMAGVANFSISFAATDVDGKVITWGDFEGYVGVDYEVEVPANTYNCSFITPAEGEVTALKDFILTFTNDAAMLGDNIGGVDTTKVVVLKDKDGNVVAQGTIAVDFDAWTSDAVITLDKEITELGTYTLVVPEGTVYNSSYNADEEDKGVDNFGAIYNPELTYTYTVALPAVVVNPDPSQGILAEVPESVIFTFNNEIKEAKDAAVIVGMGAFTPIDAKMISVKGKEVTIQLPVGDLAGVSSFSLSFAATDVEGNVITFGDGGEGYVSVTYEVAVPANTYICSAIDPAEGDVASLKQFKLTFTNEDAFMGDNIGGVDETKEIVLQDQEGQVVAKGTVTVDYDAWSSDAFVTLDKEITAAGSYTLVVPEATVYNSGYNADQEDKGVANFGAIYNPELNFTFTIAPTGIEGVAAEPDSVKVYNLQGVLVAKSLKNLPKGVYVVNGKKMIVK